MSILKKINAYSDDETLTEFISIINVKEIDGKKRKPITAVPGENLENKIVAFISKKTHNLHLIPLKKYILPGL